jgi:hypothetical protein
MRRNMSNSLIQEPENPQPPQLAKLKKFKDEGQSRTHRTDKPYLWSLVKLLTSDE